MWKDMWYVVNVFKYVVMELCSNGQEKKNFKLNRKHQKE